MTVLPEIHTKPQISVMTKNYRHFAFYLLSQLKRLRMRIRWRKATHIFLRIWWWRSWITRRSWRRICRGRRWWISWWAICRWHGCHRCHISGWTVCRCHGCYRWHVSRRTVRRRTVCRWHGWHRLHVSRGTVSRGTRRSFIWRWAVSWRSVAWRRVRRRSIRWSGVVHGNRNRNCDRSPDNSYHRNRISGISGFFGSKAEAARLLTEENEALVSVDWIFRRRRSFRFHGSFRSRRSLFGGHFFSSGGHQTDKNYQQRHHTPILIQ
jgi:hypothetical protein